MDKKTFRRELLGFDDRWYMAIGIPLMGLSFPFLFFDRQLSEGFAVLLPAIFVSTLHAALYWLLIRNLLLLLRKKFPNQSELKKRFTYSTIAVIIIFVVVDRGLDFFIDSCFNNDISPKTPSDIQVAFSSLIVIAFIVAVYEGFYFYAKWESALIEREQLKRENIESQLEGLKSQVNPHFLFNSLNTLAYIIPEDPEKAVQFVQKLSKVYRYILEIRDKKLIAVKEELDFLQAFCFLLKERFGENIRIEIAVPEYLENHRIIPLSMQMLFENAIKHNIISSSSPLTIQVRAEGKQLIISNNLQRKKQIMDSTKVGLQNIKNRYSFYTQKTVEVTEDKNLFIVKLPLIPSLEYTLPYGV